MSDIVTRLQTACSPESPLGKLFSEAARAIERLRAERDAIRKATIEECIRIVASEVEFEGEPQPHVILAMDMIGSVANARIACKTTKDSIMRRLRSLSSPGTMQEEGK